MSATLKPIARHLAMKTLLRPPLVRYCSQTIYEALLGCCRMWEATGATIWQERANRMLDILLKIQRPDGGFDIGYDFNFGRFHKRGDSTSPELVGLVAFCEYGRLFGTGSVTEPARRAAEWISRHSLDLSEEEVAIPYSPHTINEVMVYNGTSFACGALGRYLGQFGGDDELHRVYHGMVRYLSRVMTCSDGQPGRFWYYSDQSRTDLGPQQRAKIDYYHQMQQVEMHALAEQVCPALGQPDIIRDAADHIVYLAERNPVLPYTNDTIYFKDQIHLWGLASVVPGMLEASSLVPDRATAYRTVADSVARWTIAHGWRGQCFADVLERDGTQDPARLYMVRSDAWVFNAMAAAVKHLGAGPWSDVVEACFQTMESVDFSGPESHATCKRKRLVISMLRFAKSIRR